MNIDGLLNILNAKDKLLKNILGCSIAVFGPTTPKKCYENAITEPMTIYGVSKLAGEAL